MSLLILPSEAPAREVPPDGSPKAKMALIGQAPARVEDETGKPFVGRAGSVLQQCFHSANIARPEVFITNVVKTRPPNDNITPFINNGIIHAKGQYWVDRLQEELSKIEANVFIPVGNEALLALTGKWGITKWRGSILDSTLLPGRKVIPSIHPASVTYGNFAARYFISEDFKRAKKESEFPEIRLPKRNYIIRPSWEQAINYVENCHNAEIVSFDIETVNNEVSCISFSTDPMEAISVPVSRYSSSQEIAVWKAISKLLGDERTPKVGQNLAFDTQFLLNHNRIITRGEIHDTMIANHILYPDFPKGLDFLVSFHLDGEPYYKDEGKQWKEKYITDWDQFWTYNAKDAALTLAVWNVLKYQIREIGHWETYRFTMDMLDPINFMVLRGLVYDKDTLESTKLVVGEQADKLQTELDTITGTPLNINSPKQCKEYFYEKLGIPPLTRYDKKTKTSKPTVDDKALESLSKGTQARPPLKEAKLIQQIRGNRKLLSTYLEITFDKDNRFRCSYDLRGTTTGRLSSRKTIAGTGMNHQNLPEAFRAFIIPDENCIFVEWDKRQAEWVVVAYLCDDPNMIYIVENNLDAHAISGTLISGLPEEYVMLEHDYIDKLRDPTTIETLRKKLAFEHPQFAPEKLREQFPHAFWPRSYAIRAIGKHSNHGYNYDMAAARFMIEYETSLEEAQITETRYHQAYPKIRKWHEATRKQLFDTRTLENCFGRRRKFFLEMDDDLFKSAYDFVPQSTVADNTNRGMIRIYYDRTPHMQPLQLLLNGHDSLLSQTPLTDPVNLAKTILRGTDHLNEDLEYSGHKFQIKTDTKIGFDWKNMIEVTSETTFEQLVDELPTVILAAKNLHLESREALLRGVS